TNTTVSYPFLKLDQPSYNAAITVQDAKGRIGTANVIFDTFNPTNFIFEAEEFDYTPDGIVGGQFIDAPAYTSYATNTGYFGLDSLEAIDTHKGAGNGGVNASDYRAGAADATKTQTAAAVGELPRQKFLNLVAAGDTNVVDHVVGNWGSAAWEISTKTSPAGKYNVYGRLAAGAGAAIVRL